MTAEAGPARRAALKALGQILDRGQTLDEAIGGVMRGLSPPDQGLTRAIVMASVRHRGSIEHLLDGMLKRPLPRSGRIAHLALLSGAAQLLFVGLPAHAVVNEQVSLLPEDSKFRGLVNAVLRRLDRDGGKRIKDPKILQRDLPLWLWKRWKAAWGAEPTMACIRSMSKDRQPLDIAVKSDGADWAERLKGVMLNDRIVRIPEGGSPVNLPGYDAGEWWVQDVAAALPARLLKDIDGKRVLDACAAPGGKTAQLAAAGARVTALDRSEKRLKRLRQNMERLKLGAEIVAADLRCFQPDTLYDAILLDAPCSATGTLRRNPDIGWKRSDDDVATLAALQAELLDAAADLLVPGGQLVYSTCSLEREEGEDQIAHFLLRQPRFRRARIRLDETGLDAPLINRDGELRTLPAHLADRGGMDGFFAARLIRE